MTDVASSWDPEIDVKAQRHAGLPLAILPPRFASHLIMEADNPSIIKAIAIPPDVQSVSRHVPEKNAARPIRAQSAIPMAIR